jgi:hypothetical protein
MYSIVLISSTMTIAVKTAYQAISGIMAAMCLVELIRILIMMRIMVTEKIKDLEPIIYNCMVAAAFITAILGLRCAMHAVIICGSSNIGPQCALNVMPVIIFIYMLRLSSKLLWEEDVCLRHGIDDKLWKRRKKQ